VEDDHREIAGPLDTDGGKAAEPHQHLTVAGDYRHAPLRLRQRDAKPDHRGAAHRAPEIEVAIIVAERGEIPRRRAKAGNNQQIVLAAFEQHCHGGAALQRHLVHTLRPINSCDSSTATMRPSPNVCCKARSAVAETSSGLRTRCTCASHSLSTGSTIEPIGTCHGLNSSHSPRIVTSISIGKRQVRISESMLTQLPTPLDCINSTERSPPSHAPAASATPSSSVVNATSRMSGSARQRSISREWPASGT